MWGILGYKFWKILDTVGFDISKKFLTLKKN